MSGLQGFDLGIAYPSTVTDLRALAGSKLIVDDIEGERWASNTFYLTLAKRFDQLAAKDGITEPGVYDNDGKKFTLAPVDPPDLGQFLNAKDYTEPVKLERIEGRHALVAIGAAGKRKDETLAAVARRGGERFGLNAHYLRFLIDPAAVTSYGVRFDLERVTLRQQGNGSLRPVGVFATPTHKRGGHRDPNAEGYKFVPETWEPGDERLLGVLMPVRLAS